jgi:hypothetical protein
MAKHMAKRLLAIAALIYLIPAVASAAWWNPLSWGGHKESINTISGSRVIPATQSASTTIADLQSRVAILEQELQDALAKLNKQDSSKGVSTLSTAADGAQASGISDKLVMAQVTPAIVFVETATSSGSGAIIDSQGHILTTAHTIWAQDDTKAVVGVANSVTVTLSNGTKKSAKVIGMDQANDIAIVQLLDKSASSYIKTASASTAGTGDKVYVASFPINKSDVTLGSGFVAGTISRKTSTAVDIVVDNKPLDNGGVMIDGRANLIGIPHITSCKILEEMSNCLKYVVTANNIRGQISKVIAGMVLYTNKKYSTTEESLIRGYFDAMRQGVQESGSLDYAVRNVTGQNSFDNFNSRLGEDTEGKITKIYLNKLKLAAIGVYQAVDFLKSQAYNLDISLKGEEPSRTDLSTYQAMITTKLQNDNAIKEKEYEAKVTYWSKKQKEYDALLANPAAATHDYLMEEGVFMESSADYIIAEKNRILNVFSGENVNIF